MDDDADVPTQHNVCRSAVLEELPVNLNSLSLLCIEDLFRNFSSKIIELQNLVMQLKSSASFFTLRLRTWFLTCGVFWSFWRPWDLPPELRLRIFKTYTISYIVSSCTLQAWRSTINKVKRKRDRTLTTWHSRVLGGILAVHTVRRATVYVLDR
jgi:hypothetical protein